MTETGWLADRFEQNRGHLRAVAYRMLGSLNEADDAVQETWLRLSRTDAAEINNLGGWLTTVTARVCLDMLRARQSRREEFADGHGVEPLATGKRTLNPEQEALLADSVGLALLVVLDRLTPPERVAFVLHDTFGLSFDEIGKIVGRTPTATRQLASGLAGGRKELRRFPTQICGSSVKSSTHFSRRCAPGISRALLRFWIRMWWCISTRLPHGQARRGKSTARASGLEAPYPLRLWLGWCGRHCWMVLWGSCGRPAGG